MTLPNIGEDKVFPRQYLAATISKPYMHTLNNTEALDVGVWSEYYCTGDCAIVLPDPTKHELGDFVGVFQVSGETTVTYGPDSWDVIKAADEVGFAAYGLFKIMEKNNVNTWVRAATGGTNVRIRDIFVPSVGQGNVSQIVDDNLLSGYAAVDLIVDGVSGGIIEFDTTSLSINKQVNIIIRDGALWTIRKRSSGTSNFLVHGDENAIDSIVSSLEENIILNLKQFNEDQWTIIGGLGEWKQVDSHGKPVIPSFVSV